MLASSVETRKNGLTIYSCNLIFWTVIMPIVIFGCEIWVTQDSDAEELNSFRRFAGRRIQRFPNSSPNITSFFGLVWVRITTYLCIKKILFICTILRL